MESINPRCFAAVIRHGERGDRVPNFKVYNDVDPPLTKGGMQQAKLTGMYLNQYFTKNGLKFDKVIIEVSPFLRTMMTAGEIAAEFGVKDIRVNYQACEALHNHIYDEDPMSSIEFEKAGKDFDKMVSK